MVFMRRMCFNNLPRNNVLLTLKVCVSGGPKSQEPAISHHLKNADNPDGHPGVQHLRVALDDFLVEGPHASHQCLVFPVLGKTLAEVRDLFKDRAFDVSLLQRYMMAIVHALDVLHQEGIVHTGMSLLGLMPVKHTH
jgi:serine/threonine protein kinase